MTLVLAFSSSLLWGAADFVGGTVSRRRHPFAVTGASQLLALALFVPVAVLSREFDTPLGYLPWAAAAGVVGLIALVAFYAALAGGTMGVVAPVAATGVVLPVVVGLARGEQPSGLALAGIAAVVLGVVFASGPDLHPRFGGSPPARRAALRSLLLAGVAAVGFGLVMLTIAEAARSSVAMTLVAMRGTTGLFVLAVAAALRTRGSLTAGDLPTLAFLGIADAAANGAFALATRGAMVSVVAVLASLYPAVTALLARQVHGERLRRVQQAGVAVTLAGVALIAVGGGGS